jgi:hypothetical protein
MQMHKTTFRFLLLAVLLLLALPFAVAKLKYPKTAQCPIDAVVAKATGKTKPTENPECISVEYRHRWTDYSSPLHPERLKHEFWLEICNGNPTNIASPPPQ